MFQLSSLNNIVIVATVKYDVSTSEGNFSLLSAHLEIQVLRLSRTIPSWLKIISGGGEVYIFYKKFVVDGRLFQTGE